MWDTGILRNIPKAKGLINFDTKLSTTLSQLENYIKWNI